MNDQYAEDPYSIESQYQFYLSLCGLEEDKMPAEQKRQLRHAYYAACGQMFILQDDFINVLPEEDAEAANTDLRHQVYMYMQADLETKLSQRRCRICGCTDDDCSQCIERTGEPCHWVEEDLCSACEIKIVSR